MLNCPIKVKSRPEVSIIHLLVLWVGVGHAYASRQVRFFLAVRLLSHPLRPLRVCRALPPPRYFPPPLSGHAQEGNLKRRSKNKTGLHRHTFSWRWLRTPLGCAPTKHEQRQGYKDIFLPDFLSSTGTVHMCQLGNATQHFLNLEGNFL